MDVWSEFAHLFSGMDAADALLLGAGLVFLSLEIVRRSKGAFAGLGGAALLAGFATRLSHGGGIAMFFFMALICCAALLAVYLIDTAVKRYNFLLKVPGIDFEETDEGKDYYYLLGLDGVAVESLSPSGKIAINNVTIAATLKSGSVNRGAIVRVVGVEGQNITVEQIEN